ncbi:MAG: hypothetical protein RLN99_16660, partial [Kiloniellaceae bacterium]
MQTFKGHKSGSRKAGGRQPQGGDSACDSGPDAAGDDFLALLQARLPAVFYRGRLSGGSLTLDQAAGRPEALTGLDAATLCAGTDGFFERIHPDDRAAYRQSLAAAAA